MSKKIFSFCPIFLLLAACAVRPTPLSPTVTLSSVATRLPLLTDLPQSTVTGTITATPKPTNTTIPTSTQTLTPTIDTTTTAIVATLVSTVQPHRTTFTSPDRRWEAQFLTYNCTKIVPEEWYESAYELLQIAHLPDGNASKVEDQLQYCGGVGGYGLGGIVWSPNSRFFYFTTVREGVPDGTGGVGWHRPILRFDTVTSNVEPMGSSLMSPDGQKIASIQSTTNEMIYRCGPKELVVQTLDGDILFRYSIDIDQQACHQGWSSYIAWATTNEELVYLETSCLQPMDCQSNLYRVNLVRGERQSLLQDHKPFFVEVTWSEPNRLSLTDQDFNNWYYILSTGQLEKQDK
jgi:hypothetical protein